MKPTIPGLKRPLESNMGNMERASKRSRISQEIQDIAAILCSLGDSYKQGISPTTQEVLRVVNTSLQTGHALLDLSHLSADHVADLPISLLNPAINSVQTLLLPPGLRKLPSFCKQLASLQRLNLPDFAGSSLDLRGMKFLHQLNGTASGMFRYIFANTLADIYFRAPETTSKIRVYRYEGEQLVQQHALPSHSYFKVLPENTEPDFTSLNGKAFYPGSRVEISCDTIAPEILNRRLSVFASNWKKTGYFGVTNADSLSNTITADKSLLSEITLKGSNSYALVSNEKFNLWLFEQFTHMLSEAQCSPSDSPTRRHIRGMRVFSSNHELHFLMIIKSRPTLEFIAEMYDPNLTRTHRRMVANKLEQIVNPEKPWRLTDFITEQRMKKYMQGNEPAMLCFARMEQRTAGDSVTPELWISESEMPHPDIMFTLVDIQLTSFIKPYWQQLFLQYEQKKISLLALFLVLDSHSNSTYVTIKFTATNYMLNYNHKQVIDEFVTCIAQFAEAYALATPQERSALPEHPLRMLLSPLQSWSQFIARIPSTDKAGLHTYFSLAGSLLEKRWIPANDIVDLLSAENSEGHGAVAAALVVNDPESVRLLGMLLKTLVARGELSEFDALLLIDRCSNDEISGEQGSVVWSASAHNSSQLMHALSSLLIDLCKKKLASEAPLLSFTSEMTETASFIDFFHPLSEEWSAYDPFQIDINSGSSQVINSNENLRKCLRTLIFGKDIPGVVPVVLNDGRRTTMLKNMQQLVHSLTENKLLSIFDDASRYTTAKDSTLAKEDKIDAYGMVQMKNDVYQALEEDADQDFWR